MTVSLAKKAKRVIAVDLADKMIEYARFNNAAENIEYICGNVLDMDFAGATVHHLPFDRFLEFARDKLRTGGKLIVFDLLKASSRTDFVFWGFAVLLSLVMNLGEKRRLGKDDPCAMDMEETRST